jgi:2-polyprenyl-3-methyl-5-hydroxy-6-metoxy-1,4-benzoquinol methylase
LDNRYLDNPRPEVLRHVPAEARRVLDVGCWRGAFGAALRERGAEVWGVEQVGEAADVARERLDRVETGTLEAVMPDLPSGTFDLITFNDVLEHLAWPQDVLRDCARLLAPGGRVLAAIPNIRHWPALMEIVNQGDFPYAESGVFDRTHLRFFTRKSIPRLFEEAGYEVEALHPENAMEGRKLKLLNLITRGKFEDCKYLHFVVLARTVHKT